MLIASQGIRNSMRVLFVNSTHFPEDWQNLSNGSQRRKKLFFDAIKEIAEIDFLYYLQPELDDLLHSRDRIARIEDDITKYWDARVNLFLCHQEKFPPSLSKLKKHGDGVFNFFKHYLYFGTSGLAQVQFLERCLDRQPDLIFVQRLTSMPPLLLTKKALPPIIFDLDDLAHIQLLRQLKNTRKLEQLFYCLHLPASFWGELAATRLAQKTFVCSELDRKYLSRKLRFPGIETIPNAVSIPEAQPITSQPNLLLLGSYEHGANVTGANFLIERVWPFIYQQMPEAILIIAGKKAHNLRKYGKELPGVEFRGFVEDLDDLYRQTRIVCCPIFEGSGTRVKMVEAAAYGKPIVATRIGAEGLNMFDGQEFLLRDHPQKFAQACLDLIRDHKFCEQIGSQARQAAIQYYDQNKIIELIQKNIQQIGKH